MSNDLTNCSCTLLLEHRRTRFDSDGVTAAKTKKLLLSLEFAIEIKFIIRHIGVVFSFMRSLSLDCYNFDFLIILKETLTIMSLSNPVLQYRLGSAKKVGVCAPARKTHKIYWSYRFVAYWMTLGRHWCNTGQGMYAILHGNRVTTRYSINNLTRATG